MHASMPDGGTLERSSKTTTRRDAERLAAKREGDLRTGFYERKSKLKWVDFAKRHVEEELGGKAPKTAAKASKSLLDFGKSRKVQLASDATAAKVSSWQVAMRPRGRDDQQLHAAPERGVQLGVSISA